ncbi:TerD family protein [Streptomyces sp. NPDC049555]|uniref:TerD family protein n=1 Tax=Streptomyces sp. NPDC049555 TaxID=3154930 RepID=UPI0034148452
MGMLKGANIIVPAQAVRIELGWRPGPGVPDVDAAAVLLTAGRVRSDDDLVLLHGRPVHPSGTVRHEGRGSASGATETLAVDLAALAGHVERVVIAALADGPFGRVPGLHVRVLDAHGGRELARFDSTDATVETALVLGELYRRGGQWKFRAVGQGWNTGYEGLAAAYGLGPDRPSPRPAASGHRPGAPAPGPATPGSWPAGSSSRPGAPGSGRGAPGSRPGAPSPRPAAPPPGPGAPGSGSGTPASRPAGPASGPGGPASRPGTPAPRPAASSPRPAPAVPRTGPQVTPPLRPSPGPAGPPSGVPQPAAVSRRTGPQAVPPPAAPVAARPAKVTLTKEAPAVSLAKQGGTSGVMRVNLNWQMLPRPTTGRGRRLGVPPQPLDLDLGALWELTDGSKGVVQPLGESFGALHEPPYIHLDGDDRTGEVETGENLTINLDHAHLFRRILVFVTIYEGARSFAGLHATVTLQPQHGAPIEFALDECTVASDVCALALITNQNGELVVHREARYLVPERGVGPQRAVDRAYGWGLRWRPARK